MHTKKVLLVALLSSLLIGCGADSGGDTPEDTQGTDKDNDQPSLSTRIEPRVWQSAIRLSDTDRTAINPVVKIDNKNSTGLLYTTWVEKKTSTKPDELFAVVGNMTDFLAGTIPRKVKINTGEGDIQTGGGVRYRVQPGNIKNPVQMALAGTGAFVAWSQQDNQLNHHVYASFYDQNTKQWSDPSVLATTQMSDAAENNESGRAKLSALTLFSSDLGRVYAGWQAPVYGQEKNSVSIVQLGTGSNLEPVTTKSIEISTNAKLGTEITIHEGTSDDTLHVFIIENGSADHDLLAHYTVEFSGSDTPLVDRTIIDDEGLKGGVASARHGNIHFALWTEKMRNDENNRSYNITGLTWHDSGGTVTQIEGIPNKSYDAGHVGIAVSENDTSIIWRQAGALSNSAAETLYAATIDQNQVSDIIKLSSNGAISPRLVDGNDDKLYAIWNNEYFNIRESSLTATKLDWQDAYRPGCVGGDSFETLDECKLKDFFDVEIKNNYGAITWANTVNSVKSVFLMLSDSE